MGGGGLDLLSVFMFSPLSFLQYMFLTESIQLKKDLQGLNIKYAIVYV